MDGHLGDEVLWNQKGGKGRHGLKKFERQWLISFFFFFFFFLFLFIHKTHVIRQLQIYVHHIDVNLLMKIDKSDACFWQKKCYDVFM